MTYGLSEKNIAQIYHIFDHYNAIDRVILYGSRAKGNYREGSDIDLAFTGDDLDLMTLNKIRYALDDSLLPYKFDLCLFRTLKNQDIIDHIHRVGVTFYENENKNDK